jgi:hypothetical protein
VFEKSFLPVSIVAISTTGIASIVELVLYLVHNDYLCDVNSHNFVDTCMQSNPVSILMVICCLQLMIFLYSFVRMLCSLIYCYCFVGVPAYISSSK